MTIKGTGVFANNNIVIVGKDSSTNPISTGMSGIKTGKTSLGIISNLQADSVTIENSLGGMADFTNPELDTVLSSLGFSIIRPSIVGAFEFQPFIIESDLTTSPSGISSKDLTITSAAQLADMHSQLKQLRYNEVLEFLEKQMGLKTRSLYGIYGQGIAFDESSDDKGLLSPFSEDMGNAKKIIDTLTEVYNSIYPILEAMKIKYNDYKSSETVSIAVQTGASGIKMSGLSTAMLTQTPAQRIFSELSSKRFNQDYITTYVPGNIDLSGYYTSYLVLPSTSYSTSSGTVILTQLCLDVINRMFYPIYGYRDAQSTSVGKGGRVGSVLGAAVAGTMGEKNATIRGTGYVDTLQDTLSLVNDLTPLAKSSQAAALSFSGASISLPAQGRFTKGAFENFWSEIVGNTTAQRTKLGRLLYMAGSDILLSSAVNSDSANLSEYVSGINSTTPADQIAKMMFGYSTSFSEQKITEMSTSSPGSNVIETVLPRNTDSTTGTGSKVASFEFSQRSIPDEGSYQIRSGKSYFLDEIFTGETSSVISRVETFRNNLSALRTKLINSAIILKAPESELGENPNKVLDVEVTAMGLTESMYSLAGSILLQTSQDLASGDNDTWIFTTICMLAAENKNVAWNLFKFYMHCIDLAMNEHVKGQSFNATMTDSIVDLVESIFEAFPGLEAPGNEDGGTAVSYENDTQWNSSDSVHEDLKEYASSTVTKYSSGMDTWHFESDSDILSEFKTFQGDASQFRTSDFSTALHRLRTELETGTVPDSILTFGYRAIEMFLVVSKQTYGISNNTSLADSLDARGPLGFNRYGLAAVGFFFQMYMWKQMEWYQYFGDAHELVTTVELTEQDKYYHYYYGTNLWMFNTRRAASVSYVAENILINKNSRETVYEDIDSEHFGMLGTGALTGHLPDPQKAKKEYIESLSSGIDDIYWKQADAESMMWNSLWYVNGIIQKMYEATSSFISTMTGNAITSGEFDTIFNEIKSDDDLKDLLFTSLSRDQLSLNSALYDSLSSTNREFPYLPASKAVMPNQVKNLATMSTVGEFLENEEKGKRYIVSVGLPCGLVDRLRFQSIDSGLGLKYFKSTVISIKIWRRNLINDAEVSVPKEFIFDLSKFIIEGRNSSVGTGTEILDAASMTEEGQTVEDILNNTVVSTYKPEDETYSTSGKAYSLDYYSTSENGKQVFQNHVLDYYLKLYMKITTGLEVGEDIFPLQQGKLFFDGPDKDMKKTFDMLKLQLTESFPTRDVTSSINFDRLLGELTRSIILSPLKWSNRVFYPKLFDRVFCMLIDEDDFSTTQTGDSTTQVGYSMDYVLDISDGTLDYSSMSSESIAVGKIDQKPTYYQFYATVDLLEPMNDSLSSSEQDLDPESEIEISAVSPITDSGMTSTILTNMGIDR